MRKAIVLAVALTTLALPALAQQQPASLPQTKAETELNAAWQQMVGAAETAAISGPDQLRAAKAAQGALQAWMAEQRQKLTDQQKDAQAKLEQAQRDRLSMSQQVAALNKQLADAKKPNAGDQATIARLGAELAQARRECARPNTLYGDPKLREVLPWPGSASTGEQRAWGTEKSLPHSTPEPGRK